MTKNWNHTCRIDGVEKCLACIERREEDNAFMNKVQNFVEEQNGE